MSTDARLAPFRDAARLVVKVGSSLLVAADGSARRDWLATLAEDVATCAARGQRVILVSSGAIALGARLLGLKSGGRASLEDAQAAAAVGQIRLAGLWADQLAAHGLKAAQMLVTLGDFEERRRWLNAAATLERLVALGVVPVLNENDSVATEEIRFGDNDRLAARVAQAARAEAVLLLSDVDGLYTANPDRSPDARRIDLVPDLEAVASLADSGSRSGMGSGGMAAKLEAARIARAAGIPLAIAAGAGPHPLARFLETGQGTVFPAAPGAPARKAWLVGRMVVEGRLRVDAGAAQALGQGRSLLAAGITAVEGGFARGDAVDVVAPDGRTIARGLVAYDAEEVSRIAGKRSDAIGAILGYAPRSAVIHRDQMVML
ncbi:glutamate 5-kinase [Thermaurantiacus sp.]